MKRSMGQVLSSNLVCRYFTVTQGKFGVLRNCISESSKYILASSGSDQVCPVYVNIHVFSRILIYFNCGFRKLQPCELLVSHCTFNPPGSVPEPVFPLSS